MAVPNIFWEFSPWRYTSTWKPWYSFWALPPCNLFFSLWSASFTSTSSWRLNTSASDMIPCYRFCRMSLCLPSYTSASALWLYTGVISLSTFFVSSFLWHQATERCMFLLTVVVHRYLYHRVSNKYMAKIFDMDIISWNDCYIPTNVNRLLVWINIEVLCINALLAPITHGILFYDTDSILFCFTNHQIQNKFPFLQT